MPFPLYTHNLLTAFDGSEDPLSESGRWAQMSGWPGDPARKVSGEMAQQSTPNTYWTAILDEAAYANLGDFEMVFDLPTFDMTTQALDFMWRLQPSGITYSTRDCYVCYTTTTGNSVIYKLVDNVETTQLDFDGSGTGTWTTGDKVGLQAIGSAMSVWRFRSSTWTEILSGTDSAYASGKMSLGGYGATMRLDNLLLGTPAVVEVPKIRIVQSGMRW